MSSFSCHSICGTLGSPNYDSSFPLHCRGPTTLAFWSPIPSLHHTISISLPTCSRISYLYKRNKTKQKSLLWFHNYLQLPSHFSTPQQNFSRELPTLVSHFLTCHSLLKPLWLGHLPYHVSKSAFVKSMSELQVVSPMVNSLSLSCMTSHQLVMAEPFSSKILPTSLVDPLPFLLLLFSLFAIPPSTEYLKTLSWDLFSVSPWDILPRPWFKYSLQAVYHRAFNLFNQMPIWLTIANLITISNLTQKSWFSSKKLPTLVFPQLNKRYLYPVNLLSWKPRKRYVVPLVPSLLTSNTSTNPENSTSKTCLSLPTYILLCHDNPVPSHHLPECSHLTAFFISTLVPHTPLSMPQPRYFKNITRSNCSLAEKSSKVSCFT